jgi:hypothetical protein
MSLSITERDSVLPAFSHPFILETRSVTATVPIYPADSGKIVL